MWEYVKAPFAWLWANKVPAGIIAAVTAIVPYQQFRLSTTQDYRVRAVQFHQFLSEAQEAYCESATKGAPAHIKILLDRAVRLEPTIRDEEI